MVQVHLGPPRCPRHESGGVAQLGERLPCTQEAIGSNPFTSTMCGVNGEIAAQMSAVIFDS